MPSSERYGSEHGQPPCTFLRLPPHSESRSSPSRCAYFFLNRLRYQAARAYSSPQRPLTPLRLRNSIVDYASHIRLLHQWSFARIIVGLTWPPCLQLRSSRYCHRDSWCPRRDTLQCSSGATTMMSFARIIVGRHSVAADVCITRFFRDHRSSRLRVPKEGHLQCPPVYRIFESLQDPHAGSPAGITALSR